MTQAETNRKIGPRNPWTSPPWPNLPPRPSPKPFNRVTSTTESRSSRPLRNTSVCPGLSCTLFPAVVPTQGLEDRLVGLTTSTVISCTADTPPSPSCPSRRDLHNPDSTEDPSVHLSIQVPVDEHTPTSSPSPCLTSTTHLYDGPTSVWVSMLVCLCECVCVTMSHSSAQVHRTVDC